MKAMISRKALKRIGLAGFIVSLLSYCLLYAGAISIINVLIWTSNYYFSLDLKDEDVC